MSHILTFYARKASWQGSTSGVSSPTGHIWFTMDFYGTFGFQMKGVISESPVSFDEKVSFRVSIEELNAAYTKFLELKKSLYFIGGDTCIGLACKVALAAGLKLTWGKTLFHHMPVSAVIPIKLPLGLLSYNSFFNNIDSPIVDPYKENGIIAGLPIGYLHSLKKANAERIV